MTKVDILTRKKFGKPITTLDEGIKEKWTQLTNRKEIVFTYLIICKKLLGLTGIFVLPLGSVFCCQRSTFLYSLATIANETGRNNRRKMVGIEKSLSSKLLFTEK